MNERVNEQWTDAARDELYTELCGALTDAGERSELFLSRLCLLLMEELESPRKARQAISSAALDPVRG